MQVNQLKERCVTRLKFSLTRDNFAETVVLADRVNHQGLQQACVNFAMQEENRCAAHHVCLSRSILTLAAGVSAI